MKKTVLLAVSIVTSIVTAGCGRDGGLRSTTIKPAATGGAASVATGGIATGGNAVASGGAIPTGGSAGPDGGTAGRTVGTGGATSSGSSASASGGSDAFGGSSASGGAAGTSTSTARSGGAISTNGGAAIGAGGSTGGASGRTGGAPGKGGAPSAGGAAGGCTGCQSLEQCWNSQLCVAKSVLLAAGFSIDATEVTRGQYSAWLAMNHVTTGQTPVCAWNASFTPDATCMAKSSVCQGAGCASHPQPCIDMCDATAYCQSVAKRLCGASEWSDACSSNGANNTTYGNTLVWGNCNDYTFSSTTTVPVGSKPACQSPVPGYAGVFDLIGNVSEWADNCNGSVGQSDNCKPRGLSFGMGAAAPFCNQDSYAQRSAVYDNVGFRCCSS